MPGPFTHIYTQRRVADFLARSTTHANVSGSFVRPGDGDMLAQQVIDPVTLGTMTPALSAELMKEWPKFAALGAIGPDLFFFLQDYESPKIPCDEIMLAMSLLYWLDDQGRADEWEGLLAIIEDITGSSFVAVLRFVIKLEKLWSKFMDAVNEVIGPILDAAGQIIDDATGGLLTELGDLLTAFKNDLLTLVATEALSWQDVFAFFSLKMRRGVDEQSFVWSDMTHYRLTSCVPRRLLAHARMLQSSADALTREHGDQLAAYALGWTTHVATDTVAHSFVNEQAGGPFRTHWQRHHLVENHIDAFNYQGTGNGTLPADDKVGWIDGYEGLNHSAEYFAVQIPQDIDSLPQNQKEGDWRKQPLPEADSREHTKQRQDKLDVDGALPKWMAEMIVRVLVEVYATPGEGGLTDKEYLSERSPNHPRNLMGMAFQNGLGDGSAMLGKWLGKLGVGDPGKASSDLLNDVAPKPPADLNVPEGFPLPWEVQATYRFMLSWFKREFNTGFDMDKPRRPTWYTPPSSDVTNLLQPPDFSGVDASDNPIEALCEIILALLEWIVKEIAAAAQLAYDLGKSVISGVTLGPRELLYETLILPLWESCETIREILVHMAYISPQSELHYPDNGELRRPNEIDYELIKLGHSVDGAFANALAAAADLFGNLDTNPSLTAPAARNPKGPYPWLPVRPIKDVPSTQEEYTAPGSEPFESDVVEYQRPWGYPDRNNEKDHTKDGNHIETPVTISGPYPVDSMPDILLKEDGPANNKARLDYEQSLCPEFTDSLNEEYIGHLPYTNGYPVPEVAKVRLASGTNPLGDPVIFSSYLIGQIAGNPNFKSNFNLDADRGFGYLCWDWIRGDVSAANKRGQPYLKPLTPPEGTVGEWQYPDPAPGGQTPPPLYQNLADGKLGHDKRTLKLEYRGRKCPPKR